MNRVRCPRCKTEFDTEWVPGDFETCPHPGCKFDFLIHSKDVVYGVLVPHKSDVAPCVKYRTEGTTRFNRRFVPIGKQEIDDE